MSKKNEVEQVETVAVAVVASGPDWTKAKELLEAAVRFDQCKLLTQVFLGLELAALRKMIGTEQGKRTDLTSSQIGTKWEEVLEKELPISRSTAYRFIEMAKVATPRLKRLAGLKDLPLMEKPIGSFSAQEQAALSKGVSKLTDGKTQLEFMYGAGTAKKPQGSGAKGGGKGGKAVKDLSADEQAALLLEHAREQWAEIVLLVQAYGDKFALLPDVEGQAQLSLLETHSKARHAWLDVAKEKRDVKVIGKILEA